MFSKAAIAFSALAGIAYATTGETVTGSLAVHAINANDGLSNATDTYTMYTGDGSASAGWPSQSSWVSYASMWKNNVPFMQAHCEKEAWGPNDSDAEIQAIKDAIDEVATATFVDHRFILAVIMQESGGCVRAPTTIYSVSNPGLMQDHSGSSTCNPGTTGSAQAVTPCSNTEITGMISEGTAGTASGDGLANCINQAATSGGTGAQAFYKAARIYNSGSIDPSGDLGKGVATHCYASDIANRLTGWVNAPHGCNLDPSA